MWKNLMIRMYGHEDVCMRLERTAYTLTAAGIFGLVAGFLLWPLWLIFCPFGIAGSYMLYEGYREPIPNNPPHKAIPSIWGVRLEIVIPEGIGFFADYWPFKVGRVLIPVKKENENFSFVDVRCRRETKADDPLLADGDTKEPADTKPDRPHSGGAVEVKGSWTWAPDTSSGERLLEFLNSGGKEGVRAQMLDIFGNATRTTATKLTWEEFTFLESGLAATLAMRITDARPVYLPRRQKGADEKYARLVPQSDWPQKEDYRKLADNDDNIIHNPIKYLDEAGDEDERVRREQEMEWFLQEALIDGVADIRGLGVIITRVNVEEIAPEGMLKEDAEAAAREYQQRKRDNMDTLTGIQLAKQHMEAAKDAGDKIPYLEAQRLAQTDRGRARQIYVNSSGGGQLLEAAALVGAGKQ